MKKMQLLSAVAASVLLATAAGAADNSDQKGKSELSSPAPAAQQKAPAEKVAPSMKAGERKTPETTGQATKSDDSGKAGLKASDSNKTEMKADEKAKPSTTGQAPKPSESKSELKSESTDKAGAAKADASKSSATVKENTEKSGAAQKSSESINSKASTTTGQGAAAGSAKLSTEQRTKITTIIREQKVAPVKLNVSVSVGTRIPASVHFYPLPQQVVVIYPEWRGYDYILVGDQIVIVDPRSHEIVAILEA